MSREIKTLQEEIKSLKEKLKAYESGGSLVRMYKGIKKQIDDISDLLNTVDMNEASLKSKDDKLFERYFKFLEKSKEITETFIYLEKQILPKLKEEAEHGGILEEALRV